MKEGGIFTILDNCLQKLDIYNSNSKFKIIALVGDKSKFIYKNIEYIEFPKSKKYWIFRLYYEFIYFKKISKKLKPDFWISLHDVTPNVVCENRFVYCHHPTLFYKSGFKDWKFDYKIGVFSFFYRYLQQINIKKNKAVFVQQHWIKKEFEQLYKIKNVVVSKPEFSEEMTTNIINLDKNKVHFFYPSFPRTFKNFEIIFDAIDLLEPEIKIKTKFYFTLDSKSKNSYSKFLTKNNNIENVNFIGILEKKTLLMYYNSVDCLIFPSKLETWGLPISEAKAFKTPMLLADLPYAKETVGNYDKVSFFDVNKPQDLANLITDFVNNTIFFQGNIANYSENDQLNNWKDFFDYILMP